MFTRLAIYKKLDDEKLKNLLNAGIDEFSKNGFSGASLNVIARKAGLSVGVIYKYYKNKNDLFLECVHFAMTELQDLLDDVLENEDDFELCLRKIIRVSVHSSDTEQGIKINKMYNTISSIEAGDFSKPLASEIEAVSSKIYTKLIAKAQKEGKCIPNANPALFAFFFDSILMMVQFSFSCEYFKERLKFYCGGAAGNESSGGGNLSSGVNETSDVGNPSGGVNSSEVVNKQLLEDQLFLFMRSAFGIA